MLPFCRMLEYGNNVMNDEYSRFHTELSTGSFYTYMNTSLPFNNYGSSIINGYGTVQALSVGTMWGTPYGSRVTYDSRMHYAIRHMYPNQNMFLAAVSTSRLVAFTRSTYSTYASYISLNRNGYTSTSYGSFSGCIVTDFIYYDEDTKLVMRYNPNTLSTPVRYYQ